MTQDSKYACTSFLSRKFENDKAEITGEYDLYYQNQKIVHNERLLSASNQQQALERVDNRVSRPSIIDNAP